jgi:hypothetical protein
MKRVKFFFRFLFFFRLRRRRVLSLPLFTSSPSFSFTFRFFLTHETHSGALQPFCAETAENVLNPQLSSSSVLA